MKTIDSHLHVWATSEESKTYPYAPNQTPPDSLINISSTQSLLQQMNDAGVDGALIVQPINHLYDHTFVTHAIQTHPDKFKGMMLFDPSLPPDQAYNRFEELVIHGFVGVRFNPYLFVEAPSGGGEQQLQPMSQNEGAVRVFRRCAELNIPVGIMCFKGIDLHYEDIISLIKLSPGTTVVLDHFGFASVGNDEQFDMLLKLAQYENVIVKISALFRVSGGDVFPYLRVKEERFDPLLEAYGADRLMFGTDFPYIQEQQGGYRGATETVTSWINDDAARNKIMGGTAERIFGPWKTDSAVVNA